VTSGFGVSSGLGSAADAARVNRRLSQIEQEKEEELQREQQARLDRADASKARNAEVRATLAEEDARQADFVGNRDRAKALRDQAKTLRLGAKELNDRVSLRQQTRQRQLEAKQVREAQAREQARLKKADRDFDIFLLNEKNKQAQEAARIKREAEKPETPTQIKQQLENLQVLFPPPDFNLEEDPTKAQQLYGRKLVLAKDVARGLGSFSDSRVITITDALQGHPDLRAKFLQLPSRADQREFLQALIAASEARKNNPKEGK